MRITSKGRVTIPRGIREQAGLLPGTEVEFVVEPDGVRMVMTSRVGRSNRALAALTALRGSAGAFRCPPTRSWP